MVYKLLHVLGAVMVLAAAGGVAVHAANGGRREDNQLRGLLAAMHGVGLVLSVVAGFGMLGASLPGWAWAKLVIWLCFGAALTLPYRRQDLAKPLVVILPLLAALAAYLSLYKPF
ncbi:MAG: hypothetical protein OXP74_01765 [Acidobacteriota bacterium]|nr:hypothetical protein [Acidobacteriota bacterium]